MNTVNKEAFDRQEIEALLPWHAAGTLNRRDADRVAGALSVDADLARHFAVVREELNETIHLNESLGTPSSRAMERVFAAIETEGARAPARRSFDLVGRIAAFLADLSPRTLTYAAGAACVAILVQGAVLTSVVLKDPSTPAVELASATVEGLPQAVVRFSPQASAADITKFLDAHKAAVVDGPRNNGFYTIRLSDEELPPAAVSKIIREMQNETNIVELIASKN